MVHVLIGPIIEVVFHKGVCLVLSFLLSINDLYLKLSKVILLFLPIKPSYYNTPDNSSTV